MLELRARGFVSRAPWGGKTYRPTDQLEGTEAKEADRSASRAVAARAPVDRRQAPEVFSIDVVVRDPDTGRALIILRRPLGSPSGRLPGDPGPYGPVVDSGRAVCHVLAPGPAARCGLRGRYG
jgi:hypothetical protein